MISLPSRKSAAALLTITCLTIIATLLFLLPSVLLAADRMYFVSIVNQNTSGAPQVILEWGPLEGNIPAEIQAFKLYRSVDAGDFNLLDQIDHSLADPSVIRDYVLNYFSQQNKDEFLQVLQDISDSLSPAGPTITETNFASFIHSVIDPSSESFNPMQRMLLIRFHPAVARAAGLCLIDEGVSSGSVYQYMLTAVTQNGESRPIGKTGIVNPAALTALPAPTGLKQVRTAGCSSIHKNLDDLRIHFNWRVPFQPQEIGLNILTYGYDLYWSETNLGIVDFTNGVPAGLYKVNKKPIVVSGEAPDEGRDGFLARDSEQSHTSGPAWKRGQSFYYYLVARDLAGGYSLSSDPLEATVVDAQPPVTPWRVHTEELSDLTGDAGAVPRLALVWDQVNPINYIRYFGTDRAVCSTDETSVCVAASDEACEEGAQVRCVDLDVVKYHIFRFTSPAQAATWGTDTDQDLWPDAVENNRNTDFCDPDEYPGNEPPIELVATISQDDAEFHRPLADKHQQIAYVDPKIDAGVFNKVFYYKIIAEDNNGNFSAFSPPVRGVLFDRSQPEATAELSTLNCDNYFTRFEDTQEYRSGDDNEILTLVDKTGKAQRYTLTRYCQGTTHYIPPFETVLSGRMENGFAHISSDDFTVEQCTGCSEGTTLGYSVSFRDVNGLPMAASDASYISNICSGYAGAIVLDGICVWNASAPGMVARGPVKVCADLQEGQTARVYYKTGDKMSPIETISYNPDPENAGNSCVEITDMAGLVTSDLCLGVRVFSQNHVGSGMTFLDCLEMVSKVDAPPPPPLIQGVYSRETETSEPYFELHWSAPSEGQAAYVISMKSEAGLKNKTIFPEARNESGQFSTTIPLDPETDLNMEWCVKMRTIATSMQGSDWSQETCAEWKASEPENLSWPRVNEPVETGAVTAFFMNEGPGYLGRPALMLSSNMSTMLSVIPSFYSESGSCLDEVPVCDGTDICIRQVTENEEIFDEPTTFSNPLAGNYVQALVGTKNFILYRQEQGKDFVQVSPLVEGFDFIRQSIWVPYGTHVGGTWHFYYQLRDPFYFLRRFEESAIGGLDPVTGSPIDPAEHTGTRMIFLDRYPYVGGSTVRYKIVFIDHRTGEPKTITTSNWLTLP